MRERTNNRDKVDELFLKDTHKTDRDVILK